MDSPAYSIRLKTEAGEEDAVLQTQRRRKIVIISVMCCVVVLLLGGLAGGVWYHNRNVERANPKADRTSANTSSVGGFQSVSAGSKRTVSGVGQTGVSGQSRGQTSAAGPASEDGGGSMKAVQVEDGSFLGRARLFYANNRRAVLIAIAVSVVVVIAIVATVTTVMLLQQQQQAVSQVTTNDQHTDNLEPHPEAARSVNVPLAVGLSAGIFALLSLVTVIRMKIVKSLRPDTLGRGIFQFLLYTIFASPLLLFGFAFEVIYIFCTEFKLWPLGVLLIPLLGCVIATGVWFAIIVIVVKALPDKLFSDSFKEEVKTVFGSIQ